jgi:hypothetical protein
MQPRIQAQRLDIAQKRIVATVTVLSEGREVPPLPAHRDPQQQMLFRMEWIADRLDELAQPQAEAQPADKPKSKKAVKDEQ